ncbi:MAG: sel1 repeat family protein [Elusimicrobiaceae bacterium]|nr:sel1 repeat family protein [Elusimicrobiaceae bacterium]
MKKTICCVLVALCAGPLLAEPSSKGAPATWRFSPVTRELDPNTRLGWMYLRGIGTKRNLRKAYRHFEQAAENGEEQALFMQASLLARGRGIRQDIPRARQILLSLVKNGNPHAAFQLAVWCERNLPCPEGPEQQARWLDYAAGNEVAPAVLRKGLLLQQTQPRASFALIRHAAEELHFRWGYYQLARAYAQGLGIAQDAPKALQMMLVAANENLRTAQFKVAQWYEEGFGTEVNLPQAFYWMQTAAQNGLPQAQSRLAQMYEQGVGTNVNIKLAKKWARKAEKSAHKPTSKIEELYLWK